MFAVGMGPIADAVFAVNTMLIAVPTGVKIFNWIATMYGGAIRFTTAMLFAIGFIAMFTIGGLSGVMHASPPADLQQTDTYFIVAHFHYVLFGGSIMGLFAGIYYWFPKMSGRLMNEPLGRLHFWLTMIGFNLTFLPMHWTGMLGMPRRVYTYGPELGLAGLNLASSIGAYILGFSALVFIVNLMRSMRHGAIAGPDPWGGATLEWSITSPPPHFNFVEVPTVHSRTPLWDEKHTVETGHEVASGSMTVTIAGQEIGEMEIPDDLPQSHGDEHQIHMPNPSYYPFLAGLGMFGVFGGLLLIPHVGPIASVFGLGLLLFSIYGWCLEPAG